MPSSRVSSYGSTGSPSFPPSPNSSSTEKWMTCNCPVRSPLLIAWTMDNGGRRFWSCPNFRGKKYKFFIWKDPPFCEQARFAIGVLIRENEALKMKLQHESNNLLEEREEKLKLKQQLELKELKDLKITEMEKKLKEKELKIREMEKKLKQNDEKLLYLYAFKWFVIVLVFMLGMLWINEI